MKFGAFGSGLVALAVGQAIAGAASWARADQVTVFAAASTADLMAAMAAPFEATAGDRLRLSIAASSTLARQIENGAPADVYLSANQAWMDYLARRDLIDAGSRTDLMGNRLVLIAPRGAPQTPPLPAPVTSSFDLAGALGDGRLAIANPDHVPVGAYAKAALTALGVWPVVARRTARLADARAVVALVGRGEAPIGVAYASDAIGRSSIAVIGRFPENSHPPITYPIAVVAGGQRPAAARFIAFATSSAGRELIRRYGFRPIGDRR